MNKVILMGRLARDPEMKRTQSGMSVARMTLAVNRNGKDKGADFISLVAFDKTADFAERYLSKGRQILVEGRIQTGSYEKDGRKVHTFDVFVNVLEFADSKPKQEQADDGDDVPF